MKYFRRFLMVISFGIFGLGSLFVGLGIFPLVKFFIKDEQKRLDKYSEIVHSTWNTFVKFLQLIGILRLKIEDIDKLKSVKNSVIISTHPSYLDVLVILSLIPQTTCFVAPRLTKNKFFKKIVESMFLVSGKSLEEMQKDSDYMLEHGFNVLIFPSGIRHRKNEQPKIRKGASLIALNSEKNAVPIIMYTSFDFLQIGQPFYDAGIEPVVYNIKCGNQIDINEYLKIEDEVEQRKELTDRIRDELYKLN